jgi:N-acetylglutamate synthase-like GNAT family acetyltransferase
MDCDKHETTSAWRQATATDLLDIQSIADQIHPDLHEQAEIFAERLQLFPEGFFVLERNEQVVGYGVSHPWPLNSIPPLNQLLGSIPQSPGCLLIHDVAVLPRARGHGAAGVLIEVMAKVARKRGIPRLALISVYNTWPLWMRLGFEESPDRALTDKLKSYGQTARYMVRKSD